MRKEKAINHFLGKAGQAKFNCAQSVIKAYFDLFCASAQEVNAFAAFGGGKAPEGRCGAYYAAWYLASKKNHLKINQFEQDFINAAGSLKCKEIRSQRKLSCLGCVEKAADLLDERARMMDRQEQERLNLFKKYGYDIPKARNFILAKAKLTQGRVLEVGTGKGHMAIALARSGLKLVSIDLDKKAQSEAKLNLKIMKLDQYVVLKMMNAEELHYSDSYFNSVISVNFIHHAKNPAKCLKEMVRVAKEKLVIADINQKGQRILEKVHALDGHRHEASKMSMSGVKEYLQKAGLLLKVYRDVCQTVIIAKKGEVK
jgi:ubiquinone/menaquinone biosynthesis C-methylase UbiE